MSRSEVASANYNTDCWHIAGRRGRASHSQCRPCSRCTRSRSRRRHTASQIPCKTLENRAESQARAGLCGCRPGTPTHIAIACKGARVDAAAAARRTRRGRRGRPPMAAELPTSSFVLRRAHHEKRRHQQGETHRRRRAGASLLPRSGQPWRQGQPASAASRPGGSPSGKGGGSGWLVK